MKKMVSILTAALLVCTMIVPAFAAENIPPTLYPTEVTEYTQGDSPRISKVYLLSADTDPIAIPTADFVRDDIAYTLLDLTRQDQTATEKKAHTQCDAIESKTKDMEKILQLLAPTQEVTTEDGYIGILRLDPTTIKTEVKGYETSRRNLTATRTYPSLSDADVALLPKTTEESGKTLTLADVQWQETNGLYTATANYTGTASNKYATGYTVTASYAGDVSKTTSDTVLYTALFGGIPIPVEDVTETIGGWNWRLVFPVGLCAAGLTGLGLFLSKKYKVKKGWKEFSK